MSGRHISVLKPEIRAEITAYLSSAVARMKGVHCEHSLPLFPWGLEVHHLLSAVSFNLSLYLSFLFLLTNCGFQKTSERAALLKRKCLKPA